MGKTGIKVPRDIASSFSYATMHSGASVTGWGFVARRTDWGKDVARSAVFIHRFYMKWCRARMRPLCQAHSTSPDTLRTSPHAGGKDISSLRKIAPACVVHIGGDALFG
jgi:hypothetical protein